MAKKKNASKDESSASHKAEIIKAPEKRNRKKGPANTKGAESGLLDEKPIYAKENSIDDMNENNKAFYEKTAKRAFHTAFKEEKTRLNELVEASYYPENEKDEKGDLDTVRDYLNLVS
jgi:hypothetical protein